MYLITYILSYVMTKCQLMFALLFKYKNVITDEEIEIIKQNKAIDHNVCLPNNPSYSMSPFTNTQLLAANVKNTGY